MKKRFLLLGLLLLVLVLLWSIRGFLSGVVPLLLTTPPLEPGSELPYTVPEGFKISLYAENLPGARDVVHDPGGGLAVSLPGEGKIVTVVDTDADGKADKTFLVLEDLNGPHGIVFVCEGEENCTLYVAEEDAVRGYEYDAQEHVASRPEKLATLPSGGGHSTRSLHLSPDNKTLLISVGSSCNVCEETDRAVVYSLDLATKKLDLYATGLRNSVFMALHPVTGDLWATEMGRDLLGDDIPPDEVNILKEGGWYGWPWFYGNNIFDEKFRSGVMPSFAKEAIPSQIDLQAHSAPLGLAFIPEEGWPEEYWHDLLVAYHGSWNRSVPTGYKVVRFDLDPKGKLLGGPTDFISGFMADGVVRGRPVDLLIEPGGTLYVTDDRTGVVYRFARE
ncbi:MAG: PQQ-dependent sugar dehydrogenase [Patescibacteria group bacterium]